MSKTATAATPSPHAFVPGNVIRGSDLTLVHEAQNEARCETVANLLCLQGAAAGWGGGSEIAPHGSGGVTWPSSSSIEVYRTWIYVDPDVIDLFVRTRVTMASGTGSVVTTIGSTSTTHAHTGTGTQTSTVSTASTGTGWQLVTVELEVDTGDPSSATLDRLVLRTVPITVTDLPDPV